MSFTAKIKNELARKELKKKCCQKAELTAFIHVNGNLQITGGQMELNITTDNPASARRIFLLVKNLFGENSELLVRKGTRLKKLNRYQVKVSRQEKVREMLEELGVMSRENQFSRRISPYILDRRCCRRSYLRGVFLARGSVNSPDSSSTHLEMTTEYEEQARELVQILKYFNIKGKMVSRNNNFRVYLKDGQKIVEFLNVVGAHQALFSYENAKILKDMRNKINRLVNCETANLNKTVNAAMNQLESIKIIAQRIGLQNLPESLRQAAELRVKYPEATLQELGEFFTPPLSKSGVNHRLRKIEKLAGQVSKNKKNLI
ncbi:MAG: DNA-binding protein WhiA [Candidatus Syntrophonatronum acetioxidans]|uniref:Probable cell division protein WhiA n=1 Tax=Candidatus Syntrophonatronum acetioxidans TaxID=1795816 RepID=A0A424YFE8_9FIRM|nr:MAG: DNA-binding protein WhiA [Candidatus Syntrophonatronum acetioxidans]